MTTKKLLQEAAQARPMLGDGAMGTQLMLAGLAQGNCGEEWNLTHPENVLAIQRRYAEAGSECIITNTFGGSRIMLGRHSQADHVPAINKAGVEIARQAFGGREGYVLGDIGPFGGLLAPFGEFTENQVREAFEEQAAALVEGGADAIIIETQTSLEELLIGIRAAQSAGAKCIIGSMAYDVTLDGSTFRTMMGVDPERAAAFMEESHRPAHHGSAQCRKAAAGEHEDHLRPDAGANGDRLTAVAGSRREHRGCLLRQYSGPHSRLQRCAGWVSEIERT
jgi:5-methyltetrahydrofolate--homocysteine methyltransferase